MHSQARLLLLQPPLPAACLQYLTTLNAIYAVNPKLKNANATLLQ